MFTFVKMQIVAATCLLFVCVVHAVDRKADTPPRPSNKFGKRSSRAALRPYPYGGYQYSPVEPPAWKDVDEHNPTYWSFVEAAEDKFPPPPTTPPPQPQQPQQPTYRQTAYVPVFDVADVGRPSWPGPEAGRDDYYAQSDPSNAYYPVDDPPPPPPEIFGTRTALIVLTLSAKPENATDDGRDGDVDDDDDLLLLLVDRYMNTIAEVRLKDEPPFTYLTVDNVSAEFPSDGPAPTADSADRTSADAVVDKHDNAVA